jgi:hypothetical protein
MAQTASRLLSFVGSDLPSFSLLAARHCFLAFARQKSKFQNPNFKIKFGFWIWDLFWNWQYLDFGFII